MALVVVLWALVWLFLALIGCLVVVSLLDFDLFYLVFAALGVICAYLAIRVAKQIARQRRSGKVSRRRGGKRSDVDKWF